MKNGSMPPTDSSQTILPHLLSKYSDPSSSLSLPEALEDINSLLSLLTAPVSKDPRQTIELAKLRKENNSLRKELSKFFPAKNSIESASKKLEHLFQVDSTSLLRYENAELKEKCESLQQMVSGLEKKNNEMREKLDNELASNEKMKGMTASLRVENTSLMLQNRELVRKNRIYEEQSGVVENLQKKLKGALGDVNKGKRSWDTADQIVQTEIEVKTPNKMLARMSKKKTAEMGDYVQMGIFCSPVARKQALRQQGKSWSLTISPVKIHKGAEEPLVVKKINLHMSSSQGILIKPTIQTRVQLAEAKPEKHKRNKNRNLILNAQQSITIFAAYEKVNIAQLLENKPKKLASSKKRNLKLSSQQSLAVLASYAKINMAQLLEVKPEKHKKTKKAPLKLSTPQSLIILASYDKPKLSHPKKKPELSQSRPLSSSLLPLNKKSPQKMAISKTTSASLLPLKSKNKKHPLRYSAQITITIPSVRTIRFSLQSFQMFSIINHEEFEVFNAHTLYKPDLSISTPQITYISNKKQHQFITEKVFALGCKKRVIRLKLSQFPVFAASPSTFSLQFFKFRTKQPALEVVLLRRFGYTPENKVTDDEEAKSTSGSSRRRNRAPARKPAIEEYFNLVFNKQTFQAVKMNFQDRDKITGLNPDELQTKATQSGIPFNMYHDWVKEQFAIFATTAAKRPSMMIKGK